MSPNEPQKNSTSIPGWRAAYNINPMLVAENKVDENGNPTGGHVILAAKRGENDQFPALHIEWQDGPRGAGTNPDGTPVLADPNGAFVEDVIWAALQRLEFFNEGKYRDRANSLAITKLEEALYALKDRQLQRSSRGVEGKHEV